jgi:Methylamine utilisation protein MauE
VDVLPLAAKALLATMLLIAGGAKLAGLAGFAATIRLFVPIRIPRLAAPWMAAGTASVEIAVGAGSLSWPAAGWLNLVVFALTCGFVVVAGAGYVFRRGQSCRCFGALSGRKFDVAGVTRNAIIAAVAAVALVRVRPALTGVDQAQRTGLLLAGLLLALVAFTAARTMAVGREIGRER